LYDIQPLFAVMRSPFLYANHWTLLQTDHLTVLLKSVPLFDPATIQLRGYMFIGLALGQNRTFLTEIAGRADIDILKIGLEEQILLRHADVAFVSESERQPQLGIVNVSNQVYLLRQAINLPNDITRIWVEVGIAATRFPTLADTYQHTFFVLSSGFIVLLLIAAWLIHINHTQNVGRLMHYIHQIQRGTHGATYVHGGIREYNQVGDAMQEMVQDLNIAATVFESAEGMLVTDQYRQILRVNKAFSEITGYGEAEAIGQPLALINSDRHSEDFFMRLTVN
jgi:PAS domain-containing protein